MKQCKIAKEIPLILSRKLSFILKKATFPDKYVIWMMLLSFKLFYQEIAVIKRYYFSSNAVNKSSEWISKHAKWLKKKCSIKNIGEHFCILLDCHQYWVCLQIISNILLIFLQHVKLCFFNIMSNSYILKMT